MSTNASALKYRQAGTGGGKRWALASAALAVTLLAGVTVGRWTAPSPVPAPQTAVVRTLPNFGAAPSFPAAGERAVLRGIDHGAGSRVGTIKLLVPPSDAPAIQHSRQLAR